MASHRPETQTDAEVVPFFINRDDYVGFFLKLNSYDENFMTFLLKRKDFNSQNEFMKNLAIIYESFDQ